jgi:glycosyltransferase involved in cell wall biosynthesis
VFERRGRTAKVEVLYNPVDVARYRAATRTDEVRASLGAGPGQRLVGTVGRIHPRKDLETFLRMAALIAAGAPDVRFAIVGAAEAAVEHDYLGRLTALVRELGLDGRVTFAGARRDIPAVMAALDLFVLSSRHEGFGRVIAEAMAAGRPMVVSDEGAPPELVEAGRYGLCARPADPADFARQVGTLLAAPVEAAAMADRARARAEAFDAAVLAARVRARYAELIQAKRSAQR